MTNEETPIVISGLVAGYDGKAILEVASLAIRRAKVTCVVGPSGCGKSTLLRNLLMLERPMRGRILVEGHDLAAEDGAALQRFRETTGVLFQSAALFNSLSLADNVAFPLREQTGASRELARAIALHKLALVGLDGSADMLPSAVSGGMRKRAGIARALALDPRYLFLDEPSAGLDPITAAGIDDLVLEIRDEFATTIVVITHEIASLRAIADDVVMLADGKVAATGALAEVEGSRDPLVRDFFERKAPPRSRDEAAFGGRLGVAARPT